MPTLDRTEQRIVGVLIEKQLSVPDSYPLSENALVDGCNQKNNRDPITELVAFQVAGALMSLQQKGFVARVDGGGRVAKFRHKVIEELRVGNPELTVLAEMLLRGPQAPGALKPRVARMGYHGSPEEIEALLQKLAQRSPPLVEQLPLGPRERDRRWRHLLGDDADAPAEAADAPEAATARADRRDAAVAAPEDLVDRVAALEQQIRRLQAEVARLGGRAAD